MREPLLFADEVEQPPADEIETIAKVVVVLRQTLQQQFLRSGQARRDVHVKSHGSAAAEFQVRSGLPAELAQGLFAEPRTYPAIVRFSNSSPWPLPDAIPDGQGLALQVEGVPGPHLYGTGPSRTQDFVMVNHPVFIARDVEDYLRLEQLRLQALLEPAHFAMKLLTAIWNPVHWRWRAMLAAARIAGQPPSHPADYSYYSMVPIRFGRYVAKYRVVPTDLHRSSAIRKLVSFAVHADAMRRLMQQTLLGGEIRFDFQVQLRTSESSMPVEDATVEWPQSESPYHTVAHLIIPHQDISQHFTEARDARAYSVWNSLVDHRPLGGINRARRQAYTVSANLRRAEVSGQARRS